MRRGDPRGGGYRSGARHRSTTARCPCCSRPLPRPPGREPKPQTCHNAAVSYELMVQELIRMGAGDDDKGMVREASKTVAAEMNSWGKPMARPASLRRP